jgi:hypothetical protein
VGLFTRAKLDYLRAALFRDSSSLSSFKYDAEQIFRARGSDLPTGRGYETQWVIGSEVFYPIEKRYVLAYLESLRFKQTELFGLPVEPAFYLSKIWQYLNDYPEQVEVLRNLLETPVIEIEGREYLVHGPSQVREINLTTDLQPVPKSSNVFVRKFEDGYADLEEYRYSGGTFSYTPKATVEGRQVRLIMSNLEGKEVGKIDGVYVNALSPGSYRGAFLGDLRKYSSNKILGHVIKATSGPNSGQLLFVPNQRVGIFIKQ